MPARIYTDKDATLTPLKRRRVAVIGFGSQGHAHALNLKNSGVKVTIGLYKGSKSIAVAKKHGFKVLPTAEAVRSADAIFVAVPDLKIPSVYEKDIALPKESMSSLLPPKGRVISCAANTSKAAAFPPSSPCNKIPQAKPVPLPWPGPVASVPPALACSKPLLRKKPKPIYSVNRRFSAEAPPPSSKPDSKFF